MTNCCETKVNLLDQIKNTLSRNILRRRTLHVNANGQYDAPQGSGYTSVYVDVQVPDKPTFFRGTGRVNQNAKNISNTPKWESTVSNAIMEVDKIEYNGQDISNLCLLGFATFLVENATSAPCDNSRMKIDLTWLDENNNILSTYSKVEMHKKEVHSIPIAQSGDFEMLGVYALRLNEITNWSIPDGAKYLELNKIYEECYFTTNCRLRAGAYSYVCTIGVT